MESILELLKAHWPIISSVIIVPLLKRVKNKIKLDWPILWWVVSVGTSIGLALGGSEIVGADAATANLNAVMTALLTQLIHTAQKTKKKALIG
jgi:hypothetical protein